MKFGRSVLVLVLLVMSAIASFAAQTNPSESSPVVAILPAANLSGEKWEELTQKMNERVNSQLAKLFAERGFTQIGATDIEAATKQLDIDLADEENFRKENFYRIGEAVHANFVVFVVISSSTQRIKQNLFTSAPEGEVKIKYWLLDVKNHSAIASAKSEVARARPKAWLGVAKGSDQQLTAADRVIEQALKTFLATYPKKD
jgi:TolB-like protein